MRVVTLSDTHIRRGSERRLPDAGLVVYGHSHIPFDGAGLDGLWLHNPGSPTERRAQPDHTIGVIDLAGGRIVRSEIRVVSPPAARAG